MHTAYSILYVSGMRMGWNVFSSRASTIFNYYNFFSVQCFPSHSLSLLAFLKQKQEFIKIYSVDFKMSSRMHEEYIQYEYYTYFIYYIVHFWFGVIDGSIFSSIVARLSVHCNFCDSQCQIQRNSHATHWQKCHPWLLATAVAVAPYQTDQ